MSPARPINSPPMSINISPARSTRQSSVMEAPPVVRIPASTPSSEVPPPTASRGAVSETLPETSIRPQTPSDGAVMTPIALSLTTPAPGASAMAGSEERPGVLAEDLKALMASGHAHDMTIIAEDSWTPVHKAVLSARSRVFAATFEQELLQVTGGSINVRNMNKEVLMQLLTYIYTGTAPLIDILAAELLPAADKYLLSKLKLQCEQQLIRSLNIENVADHAVLAFVHQCPRLRAAAINFINENYQDVMATSGWSNALRNHTEVSVEICRLLGSATGLKSEWQDEDEAEGTGGDGSLAGDLLALLDSGDYSDVTLVTGGGTQLRAHRAVLAARSGELDRRLEGAPGGVLRVEHAQEADVRAALRYMYSDRLPPPQSVTANLLALAHEFRLRGLKDYCETQLANQISVGSAVSIAIVATRHNFFQLRKACIDFIMDNIYEVMDTSDWETGILEHPRIMVTISKLVAQHQRESYESEEETNEE